jgi:hypothetical protein
VIRVGDRVLVEYFDDKKQLTITLTHDESDVIRGLWPITSPLGQALLGYSEEDEIEYTVDGRTRRVLIRRIERQARTIEAPSESAPPKFAAADRIMDAPTTARPGDKVETNDRVRAQEARLPQSSKVDIRPTNSAAQQPSSNEAGLQQSPAPPGKLGHAKAGTQRPELVFSSPLVSAPFLPGDRVRHPNYGLGRVTQIATEDVGGQRLDLVHVAFEEKGAVVKIPVKTAVNQGLRNLSRDVTR